MKKDKMIKMLISILVSLIGGLYALSIMTLEQYMIFAILLVTFTTVFFTTWLFYGEK